MSSIYENLNRGTGSSNSNSSSSTRRPQYGNLPINIWNAGGGANNAYVREAGEDELVSTNLNGLLDENGQYIQLARQTGIDMAADRGLGNSSIAAGNSQRAAIQSALPIAQGDASAIAAPRAQSQDALNMLQQEAMGNATSRDVANIGASAQMYGDDLGLVNQREGRAFSGEQQGLDRSFNDYMSQLGHSQDSDMSSQEYTQSLGRDSFTLGGRLLSNQQDFYNAMGRDAMSNPAIMSNPEGFGNYMNWISSPFSGYIDSIFSSLFGGQP